MSDNLFDSEIDSDIVSDFEFGDSGYTENKHKNLIKNVLENRNIEQTEIQKLTTEKKSRNQFNIFHTKKISLEDLATDVNDDSLKNKIKSISKNFGPNLNKSATNFNPSTEKRMERKICYEELKGAVSKWDPLVKRKRKSSQISFFSKQTPLIEKPNLKEITSNVKNTTSFDKKFVKLLSGLTKNKSNNFAKHKNLDKKETMDKAIQKSKDFFDKNRNKRVKKIKSRKYRKMLKREKNKKINDLKKDGLLAEESKENLILARAKERMDLRHKNTSKWAKRVAKRPFLAKDSDIKNSLEDMRQIDKNLRKRVEKERETDNNDENLFDVKSDSDDSKEGTKKGIFALKFMKKALEKNEEKSGLSDNDGEKFKTLNIFKKSSSNFKNNKTAKNEKSEKLIKEFAEFDSDSEDFIPLGESEDNNDRIAEVETTGFEREDFMKKQEENVEDENSEDENVGWGSWAGKGIRKKKKIKKTEKKPLEKTVVFNEEAIAETLSRVTIPEKPSEFKSENKYNKLMETSIGRNWNTEKEFVEKIKKRVVFRKGIEIEPMEIGDSFK
ncbi:hypothetical protein MHBO_001242 [Bonamia ostreae]|uniref:U3 small nucleolar RNA-associated protein 14 n=1 Tax=Bonamia ostreae TaxID=126728 RepID=A0ABV2AIT8_9EUKA